MRNSNSSGSLLADGSNQKAPSHGGGYSVLSGAALVALGALLLLVASSLSSSLSPLVATQQFLGSDSGQMELCQMELQRAKSGQALDQCETRVNRLLAKLDSADKSGQCPKCDCPSSPSASDELSARGSESVDKMSLEALRQEVMDLRHMSRRLVTEKAKLEDQLKGNTGWDKAMPQQLEESAKKLLGDCNTAVQPATSGGSGAELTSWKGYKCKATDAELSRYLNYTPRAMCPQDWYFTQKLIYVKDCFALPRRRCLSITPPKPREPMPFPESLFDQSALMDSNVRWDLHQCKSFECLNSRKVGDCRNCFNLELEEHRWKSQYRGSIPMKEVIDMKAGSLRLGLDAGGGTGSFAAHMARHKVTVMTTAFNLETLPGRKGGLPYMEAIALRGLIPLHVPHKARLPLYDGVLDIIHSVNSIKYIPPVEFEELIFEWDRVLRAGGVLWFEMFYAPVEEMPVYVQIVEMVGYKKLYWNFTPKPDAGEREGEHVYLNCVLEKPARPGSVIMEGPSQEDMKNMP